MFTLTKHPLHIDRHGQADAEVEVTPEMVSAGAALIEWRAETANHEELAELVYKAMVAARSGSAQSERN
jgi:hypothetical protein